MELILLVSVLKFSRTCWEKFAFQLIHFLFLEEEPPFVSVTQTGDGVSLLLEREHAAKFLAMDDEMEIGFCDDEWIPIQLCTPDSDCGAVPFGVAQKLTQPVRERERGEGATVIRES